MTVEGRREGNVRAGCKRGKDGVSEVMGGS